MSWLRLGTLGNEACPGRAKGRQTCSSETEVRTDGPRLGRNGDFECRGRTIALLVSSDRAAGKWEFRRCDSPAAGGERRCVVANCECHRTRGDVGSGWRQTTLRRCRRNDSSRRSEYDEFECRGQKAQSCYTRPKDPTKAWQWADIVSRLEAVDRIRQQPSIELRHGAAVMLAPSRQKRHRWNWLWICQPAEPMLSPGRHPILKMWRFLLCRP